ncbi:MAG: endonuclease/exonuclease/phosphatase family protein [Planctomycetaceae bacterium]
MLAALLGSSLAGPALAAGRPQPFSLQVLCWNIHHGRGTDDRIDLPRQAAVITAAKADIVALQEVDQQTERSGGVDQLAELARLTGLHGWFAHQLDFEGGRYGQALLSRWPLASGTVHWLPGRPDRERRIAGSAIVQHPLLPFRFITTHLHHNNAEFRLEQARELARLCQQFRDSNSQPIFVAGDLNAVPDSPPVQALETALQRITGKADSLLTFPVSQPARQIDYILYAAAAAAVEVLDVKVLPEQAASDHRPLLASLNLQPAGQE